MGFLSKNFILPIIFLTLIFCLAILFDVSPLLRGPAPYPPEWQWDYALQTSGLIKYTLPFFVLGIILLFFTSVENKKIKISNLKLLLVLLALGLLFQFSVIFASRGGIFVLLHRVINPGLNGYYTTAVEIKNLPQFLNKYEDNVLSLHQHAQGHPPGGILFFYGINKTAQILPQMKALETIEPKHQDINNVWKTLTNYEKTGAIASIFIISFLTISAIVPLFYAAKLYFDEMTAKRLSFLYLLVPALTLFLPINDVFLPMLSASSFYFFAKGLKEKTKLNFFISGLIFSFGLTFSLSLFPLLIFYFLLFVWEFKKRIINLEVFNLGTTFVLSILVFPALLYFFGINFISLIATLIYGLPEHRNYFSWLIYNHYDFFIFAGIPVAVLFFYALFKQVKEKKFDNKLILTFTAMLVVLVLSGTVRGEVGRIWIPFIPFLLLAISNIILKFNTRDYKILLALQGGQIIIMQIAWAVLW